MKRRDFCRYILFSSTCSTSLISKKSLSLNTSDSSQTKSHHHWIVLYWMPYDNDLSRFGEPIIEMLTDATQNVEILVIVQSDHWNSAQMQRRQIVHGNIEEIDIVEEDSSNISALSTYLDWAYQNFEAQHWAVIVVGHGGKTNEISPDDHGFGEQNRTWMRVDQFTNAVSKFNQVTGERVELFFFQNCNKATLEMIYQARNCAKYTLASQLELGAPNYYYDSFLNYLKDPSIDGKEAGIRIMNSERIDMYHSLTLVENKAVKKIPEKLSPLCKQMMNSSVPKIAPSDLFTYPYFGEYYCDTLALFDYLSLMSNKGKIEFNQFADFLQSSVIVHHQTGGKLYGDRFCDEINCEQFCGLGLYFPQTKQDISRYSSLDLYQAVDLLNLYQHLFVN